MCKCKLIIHEAMVRGRSFNHGLWTTSPAEVLRRWVVYGLFFLLSGYANAQYAGYRPVTGLADFKKEFALQSARINSVTSNFRQDKVLSALTEKISSTGNFKFKRSNKVRIEYTRPFSYLMVMNGDKMMVKDEQKETHVNVRSNKLFQQINRIMIDCIQGTILDSRDFTTRVFEDDGTYLLEMTPVSRGLKDFFQTIVLIVEKKDYSVRSIAMNEPSGDQTIIIFTDKKLNEQVPDEVFKL
jgi:outer membrane lipoprotein-sorting protein